MIHHTFPYPPNPVQPYHMPTGPRSQEGSIYGNVDHSSIATTPNPMTPVDPASGLSSNGGRHWAGPMAQATTPAAQYAAAQRNLTIPQISTTPIEAPPASWRVDASPNFIPSYDWNNVQPSLPWDAQHRQQLGASGALDESLDPSIFSSLAELIEQGQSKATDDRGHFDFMGSLEAPMAPSEQPLESPAHQSGFRERLSDLRHRQSNPFHADGATLPLGGASKSVHRRNGPVLADSAPIAASPSAPQHMSLDFKQASGRRPHKSVPGSTSLWPLPDRAMAYGQTQGSVSGLGSPAEVCGPASEIFIRLTDP